MTCLIKVLQGQMNLVMHIIELINSPSFSRHNMSNTIALWVDETVNFIFIHRQFL